MVLWLGTGEAYGLLAELLAAEYGLPIDPVPLPAVGQGGVYYQTHYETWIAAAGFSAAAVLLWLGREQKKKGTV